MIKNSRHQQRGAETLEFAFIAFFFFALLFILFEISRLFYTWNVLTEATRRGARLATVCPYQSPIPENVAVFDTFDADNLGNSPIIKDLDVDDVTIRYLDSAGAVINVAAGGLVTNIDFVEVTINYQHQMLFTNLIKIFSPGWTGALTAPNFQTTLPAESLGANPDIAPNISCNF